MEYLEKQHETALIQRTFHRKEEYMEPATVITMQGTSLKWMSVKDMVHYADVRSRWWEQVAALVDELSGRPIM
jgi:6-phosphofructokinase 1